jgi:protein associated with RNAse G/E
MTTISVIKQNYLGHEILRYPGEILEREAHQIILEARFGQDDISVEGITFRQGDRFIETYYDNRWYNIYEIHDLTSDSIKCWYCNIAYPAVFQKDSISYRDLALDLLIYPGGKQKILDEDEFLKLPLSANVQISARQALLDLQRQFQHDRNVSDH